MFVYTSDPEEWPGFCERFALQHRHARFRFAAHWTPGEAMRAGRKAVQVLEDRLCALQALVFEPGSRGIAIHLQDRDGNDIVHNSGVESIAIEQPEHGAGGRLSLQCRHGELLVLQVEQALLETTTLDELTGCPA